MAEQTGECFGAGKEKVGVHMGISHLYLLFHHSATISLNVLHSPTKINLTDPETMAQLHTSSKYVRAEASDKEMVVY